MQTERDARAKLLFCQSRLFAFLPFSLTSPSSLLKLSTKACFKRRATAVLTWFQTSNLIHTMTAVAENKTQK